MSTAAELRRERERIITEQQRDPIAEIDAQIAEAEEVEAEWAKRRTPPRQPPSRLRPTTRARDALPEAFTRAVELIEDARAKRREARAAIKHAREFNVHVELPAKLARVDSDHTRVNLLHRLGGSY